MTEPKDKPVGSIRAEQEYENIRKLFIGRYYRHPACPDCKDERQKIKGCMSCKEDISNDLKQLEQEMLKKAKAEIVEIIERLSKEEVLGQDTPIGYGALMYAIEIIGSKEGK